MNAPGTEKRTTFLLAHSVLPSLLAWLFWYQGRSGARGLRKGANDGWKEEERDWRKEGEGGTFASIIINWDTARRDLRALLLVWDVAEDDVAGQAISNLK